jgi:hypothetical protein
MEASEKPLGSLSDSTSGSGEMILPSRSLTIGSGADDGIESECFMAFSICRPPT